MFRPNRTVLACAILSFAILLTVVGGCDPSRTGATGRVNLRITDAPFPVDLISEATVTITEIKLRLAEPAEPTEPAEDDESEPADDADDADGDDTLDEGQTLALNDEDEAADEDEADGEDDDADDEDDTWVTVMEGSAKFNLLDLRNGRTDLLATAEVPAGTYTQMRLVVTEGSITLKDGRTFTLKVPSGAQSGIKLHFTFTVEEGEEQALLLDVDLSRAFKPIPGVGAKRPEDITSFKFQPSLAMRLINMVQAGSISGTVSDAAGPLAGATVTALRDTEEVTTTTTEADGTYSLTGLPTGTYTVAFAAEGYVDAQTADVAVQAGQATEGINATLQAEAPASQPAQ